MAKVTKREHVVREILESEKSYIRSMNILVEQFAMPLQRVVPNSTYTAIFSNIQQLALLNEQLRDDIEAQTKGEGLIGKLFLEWAPYFKMYAQYVDRQDKASKVLKKLQAEDERAAAIISAAARSGACCGQTIESLLIMPVQRVPRYELLLRELIKSTPDDHPDKKDLEAAFEKVQQAASHINEAIRAQENRDKILSIQATLGSKVKILSASRVYIMQAKMQKMCRRGLKPFTFYLFNDLLLYTGEGGMLGPSHREIPLLGVRASRLMPGESSAIDVGFKVQSKVKSFLVATDSEGQADSWVREIEQNARSVTTRSKRMSRAVGVAEDPDEDTVAPVWTPDAQEKRCSLCMAEFTLLRRRHHCRKCGSLVCANCSANKIKRERACRTCFDEHRKNRGYGYAARRRTAAAASPSAAQRSASDPALRSASMIASPRSTAQSLSASPAVLGRGGEEGAAAAAPARPARPTSRRSVPPPPAPVAAAASPEEEVEEGGPEEEVDDGDDSDVIVNQLRDVPEDEEEDDEEVPAPPPVVEVQAAAPPPPPPRRRKAPAPPTAAAAAPAKQPSVSPVQEKPKPKPKPQPQPTARRARPQPAAAPAPAPAPTARRSSPKPVKKEAAKPRPRTSSRSSARSSSPLQTGGEDGEVQANPWGVKLRRSVARSGVSAAPAAAKPRPKSVKPKQKITPVTVTVEARRSTPARAAAAPAPAPAPARGPSASARASSSSTPNDAPSAAAKNPWGVKLKRSSRRPSMGADQSMSTSRRPRSANERRAAAAGKAMLRNSLNMNSQ